MGIKTYLTPYQSNGRFWYRYDLKPDRSWYGYIHYDIVNKFHSIYRIIGIPNIKVVHIKKYFDCLENAKEELDKELVKRGHILLTDEQYEKLAILI
jgi:hypothetical protein